MVIKVIAQIIGLAAMVMNITSYVQKKQKAIILFQFFGTALFTVNFFMIGAYTGACLNLIGAVRAIVYYNREKTNANSNWWFISFVLSYYAVYACTFLFFGKAPTPQNLGFDMLPVMAMIFTNLSYRVPTAQQTRILSLGSSPLWIIYSCINFSLGSILCECFCIASIFIGIFYVEKRAAKTSAASTPVTE